MPHQQGEFAAVRKHDIHTGIDLYCNPREPVYAIEDGVVVDWDAFTGQFAKPPTNWWHDTDYIVVRGKSGYILYGEIMKSSVSKYEKVFEGQQIAQVKTVLKKDKGLPMTMLHLELYSDYKEPVEWKLNEHRPYGLLDPTNLIRREK